MLNKEAPCLRFGDIVRIHGVNLSKKDADTAQGLIVSKGYPLPLL